MQTQSLRSERIETFDEFWPFYVSEHGRKGTRVLHLIGSLGAVLVLCATIFTGHWRWFPLALLPGYGFAWVGHLFIEHNRPATFAHPLWSLMGDYKMIGMMVTGQMDSEVEKYTKD